MKKKIRRLKATLIIFISLVILGGLYNHVQDYRTLQARSASYENAFNVVIKAWDQSLQPKPTQILSESDQIEAFGRFLFQKDWDHFKRIIKCESNWNTKAVSPTHDYGLSQISWVHGIRETWLKDWRTNLVVAYSLYKSQGDTPWASSRGCWTK